jgi:hypothetical protein
LAGYVGIQDTERKHQRSSRDELGPATRRPLFPRSFLVGLDANVMIHSKSEPLLAAKVLFGCLYADMAQQELDLFQFAARFMT